MKFIPTYCDVCERVELTASDMAVNGDARCTECGASSRALPGQSYAEDDVELFDHLRGALGEAGITQQNARGLANQLEYGGGHEGRGVRRLAQVVPALGILELIVDSNPVTMRKAEGMLLILLETLAAGRRPSAIVPAQSMPLDKATPPGKPQKRLG